MTNRFSETDYILNFGDSWAHGCGVDKTDSYSYLMSCSLRYQWKDYSIPSSSNGRLILQLQQFLEVDYNPDHNYTALFFITAQERQLMFDESGNPKEFHPQQHGAYYLEYYNHRLGSFHLNTTIIALQSMCRRYKIKDHYLLGWQLPLLWHEVDITKFYDYGRSNAVNMFDGPDSTLYDIMGKGHPCVISPNDGHPSKLGHNIISREWLKWIQQPTRQLTN